MVNYAGTEYYYLRNGQNDVVKLIDNSGDAVVEYIYDSWGRVVTTSGTLATTLGADQPFRYRGYVYDTETGWYYLQSRYYSPETCRFISADVLLSTGQGVLGHNSFAYCLNNPVNRVDPSGYSSFWDNLKNALTVVAVVAIAVAAVAVIGTRGMALALVGGGVAASAATAATVATAAVATGAVAAAGVAAVNIGQNIAYSNNISQRNGTPRNNQAQNKQFRDAMREAGIKDKNIMRQIHNEISKLDFSYQEIVEYALEFVKHP